MNRHLDVQLREADVLRGYRAHYPIAPRKPLIVGALAVAACGALMSLLAGSLDSFGHALPLIGGLPLLFIVLFFALQLGIHFLWLPRFTRRVYAQQADIRLPFSQDWDDDHLTTVNANGTGTYKWADFHAWHRTEDILLIYRSEALFHIIPLSGEADQCAAEDIVALLQAAGVKQRKASR